MLAPLPRKTVDVATPSPAGYLPFASVSPIAWRARPQQGQMGVQGGGTAGERVESGDTSAGRVLSQEKRKIVECLRQNEGVESG